MHLQKLYEHILDAYLHFNITALPINCLELAQQHGYHLKKYCELSDKKRKACRQLSPDACIVDKVLYYESNVSPRRIQFSIAHEFGHMFLKTEDEDEADEFASHFLAPRILIHKYRLETAVQIHDLFGLSYAASNRALVAYKNWFHTICHTTRAPSWPEKQIELIFFPEEKCQNDESEPDAPEIVKEDPVDTYLRLLRILQIGIAVPDELKPQVRIYKKLGLL